MCETVATSVDNWEELAENHEFSKFSHDDADDNRLNVCKGIQGSSQGHHSRFRKDLINLSKAVSRWLKQEERGAITRTKIVGRILGSPAAQHLKDIHGNEFQEERFV